MQTTPIRGSGSISFKLTHYPIREFLARYTRFQARGQPLPSDNVGAGVLAHAGVINWQL